MFRDLGHGLIRNFRLVFRPRHLPLHALAIALTALIVFSDTDWHFFLATRPLAYPWLVFGAGIGGSFATVLVPVGMYWWGEYKKDRRLMLLSAGVAQGALIGYGVSVFYKIFTGRAQPYFLYNPGIDISKQFHFGILQHGIFWGWPSSHAVTAFGGAVVLILLAENKLVRAAALLYALFIATGAAIGFHWLSDVLAGTIFGILAGVIVAKDFAPRISSAAQ